MSEIKIGKPVKATEPPPTKVGWKYVAIHNALDALDVGQKIAVTMETHEEAKAALKSIFQSKASRLCRKKSIRPWMTHEITLWCDGVILWAQRTT
jgi:hypothetical protein